MLIRVLDLERSIAFYRTLLGLEAADTLDVERFTVVYLRNPEADFEIELTLNKGRSEPYALGEGYGHVAFGVDDLDSEHKRLTEAGFVPQPIKEFYKDGSLLARFFFMQDPDGYKIEVLQRQGRYR